MGKKTNTFEVPESLVNCHFVLIVQLPYIRLGAPGSKSIFAPAKVTRYVRWKPVEVFPYVVAREFGSGNRRRMWKLWVEARHQAWGLKEYHRVGDASLL